jgi:hypothetical protein
MIAIHDEYRLQTPSLFPHVPDQTQMISEHHYVQSHNAIWLMTFQPNLTGLIFLLNEPSTRGFLAEELEQLREGPFLLWADRQRL